MAITQASEIIGLPVLTQMLSSTGAAMVRIGVALLIVIVGLILASMAAQATLSRAPRNAPLLALAARAAILFFAAALALHQAGLPAEIVTLAFGAVVGGIAIGLAVAVGVGGRHVAGRVLDRLALSFEPAPLAGAPAEQSPERASDRASERPSDPPSGSPFERPTDTRSTR